MGYAGVAISIFALAVSLYSLMERKKTDKRDLTLRVHEMLIAPELQAGRRLLFRLDRDVSALTEEEYGSANRALATLDVAGFYCRKGYVNVSDFLELWAPSLAKLKGAAEPFLAHRDAERPADLPVWPNYRWLVSRAEETVRAR